MKRLVCILLLLTVLRLDATLTVTNRGTQAFPTTGTTMAFVPTTTLVAGTLGVILYVAPNSGSGGNTKIFTSSTFNDSVGNTWTRRLDALYDPSTANQGIEIAVYTSPVTTQVTASDNITVTISPTTLNKLVMLWEVSGANGTPTYVTSAAISDGLTSGQNGTAVSVTSSSITNGDAIIAWNGGRDNTTQSAVDTDTTNGSWSSVMTIGTGTATRMESQYKVTTGTGTQTWDITLGAAVNWECGWIQVREATTANDTTDGFFLWQ